MTSTADAGGKSSCENRNLLYPYVYQNISSNFEILYILPIAEQILNENWDEEIPKNKKFRNIWFDPASVLFNNWLQYLAKHSAEIKGMSLVCSVMRSF